MMGENPVETTVQGTEIAIVGMACRVPGARTPDEFWQNIAGGVESISQYSDDELRAAGVDEAVLRAPNYVKAGAPLRGMDQFDARLFGLSPRDASIMDPQHRQFLEVAWEALEDAGHDPDRFNGTIGIYGGSGMNAYLPFNLLTNPSLVQSVGMFLLRHTGNDKDFLTTRVSYALSLRGPSINIQTACSTSLVAIHIAAQSLLNGECDMALAGGVTIELPHGHGYYYQHGEVLSPDGHCRAFDAAANGTVFGSGAGIVVLRRLSDAIADGDAIRAVIRATAINNDGASKVGYLAPSVEGQARAVAEALALAAIPAESIAYLEAHGTGTPMGDPIEVSALTQAFRTQTERRGFCSIGSVKTNIGHLDTAAGVIGAIKVVKALEHGYLPPSLNFETPNPAIDFAASPFEVSSRGGPWPVTGTPRRAALNSLGIGGTNAFAIFEQAPMAPKPVPSAPPGLEVLLLSARSAQALDRTAERLADALASRPELDLGDVAHTLQTGRRQLAHQQVVVAASADEAIAELRGQGARRTRRIRPAQVPSLAYLFPGGGAQFPGMGRQLYDHSAVYRQVVDECLQRVSRFVDGDVRAATYPTDPAGLVSAADALMRPSIGLPALFIVEYALAQLWMAWGCTPSALIGHSVGEYAAACIAGVFTLDDALEIVALRGRLFEALPKGCMVAVHMPESALRECLGDGLSIAAVNGPEDCVVSGPTAAVDALEAVLKRRDIDHTRLKISVAAHSPMLEPILPPFRARLRQLHLKPPAIPFVSNLSGTWIDASEAVDPEYWVRHLRQTVRFADGMRQVVDGTDWWTAPTASASRSARGRRSHRWCGPIRPRHRRPSSHRCGITMSTWTTPVSCSLLPDSSGWPGCPSIGRRSETAGHVAVSRCRPIRSSTNGIG